MIAMLMGAPYLAAAAVVASAVCGAWGYKQGRADGRELAAAQDARERDIAAHAAQVAAASAAEQIARIRVQHTTVRGEVEREVLERVVYRECVHSADQLQRINAAISGAAIASSAAGGGQLPRTDAAAGPELRGDDAQAARGGRPVP